MANVVYFVPNYVVPKCLNLLVWIKLGQVYGFYFKINTSLRFKF